MPEFLLTLMQCFVFFTLFAAEELSKRFRKPLLLDMPQSGKKQLVLLIKTAWKVLFRL